MNSVCVKVHPELGILVGNDGHVMVPATKFSKAHWTLGSLHKTGYRSVQVNGKEYLVHRLVAQTFLNNPDNKPQVDHKDRNPLNNASSNLRFCTRSGNQRNTRANDRCMSTLGVNYYTDSREANRRHCALWYQNNKDSFNAKRKNPEYREKERSLRRKRREFGRYVSMASGNNRFFEESIAQKLLAMPRNQRTKEALNELGCK